MNRKKELCRNFQSGSCRYGASCRYLHVQPQQQQQQQQQPKPNPFGFGVQQPNFNNKWTRPSSTPTSTATPNAGAPPPASNHSCTDSDLCKRQIAEDFKNERPLWKLTCYAHWKCLPCDVSGDISYEELRSAAYDDAKRGLPLHSIVERERSLLNSKLTEFENLLRNPYVTSKNNVPAGPTAFPGSNRGPSPVTSQNNVPPSVPSFNQLSFPTNQASSGSSLAPSNSSFQQPSPQASPQISGIFGVSSSFQQPSSQVSPQISGFWGVSSRGIGTQGLLLGQQAMQSPGASTTVQMSFPNAASTNFPSDATRQSPIFPNVQNAGASLVRHTSLNNTIEGSMKDTSIWLKQTWNPREIPEEAPPAEFCS